MDCLYLILFLAVGHTLEMYASHKRGHSANCWKFTAFWILSVTSISFILWLSFDTWSARCWCLPSPDIPTLSSQPSRVSLGRIPLPKDSILGDKISAVFQTETFLRGTIILHLTGGCRCVAPGGSCLCVLGREPSLWRPYLGVFYLG